MKTQPILSLTLLAAAITAAHGQGPLAPGGALRVPAPNPVSQRAAELADAEKAWREADHGLESHLLRGNRAATLERLDEAEERMLVRVEALRRYNAALLGQARQMLTDLETGTGRGTALADVTAEAAERERRQADDLGRRIAVLEARLAAMPPPNETTPPKAAAEYQRIDGQIKAGKQVRDDLRRRAALRRISAQLARDGEAHRYGATDQVRTLVKALERELQESGGEAPLWSEYYAALRMLVLTVAPGQGKRGSRQEQTQP